MGFIIGNGVGEVRYSRAGKRRTYWLYSMAFSVFGSFCLVLVFIY